MTVEIDAFKATPIDSIKSTHSRLSATFFTHKTKPLEYRQIQLRKLYWGIRDNADALVEALHRDLGKPTYEATIHEVGVCMNECIMISKLLPKWMKDEKSPYTTLTNLPLGPKIRKDPMGCVLVIGAFNFPVQLSLSPFIGAIAAGNTVVLKPSEGSPYSAMVLQRIVENYLDPSAYAVVQGAVPETTALLDLKWDKICYTGGEAVGKIIAKKAAETLTPIILELGGRNPAIITKNADPRLAARRLLWAKVMNAGQVCVSQNYVLIDKAIVTAFVDELKVAYREFYPNGTKESPDYGRIVNARHFQRIETMLKKTGGTILMGGATDASDNFIEPTVIEVTDLNDSLIVEESFGPLIPIYAVKDLDEAIHIANEVSVTPLGIYPFGTKAETDRILNETRSGGASVNDGLFHAAVTTLAFGGVGSSGQGSYKGRSSFDAFVHRRSVITTPSWMERLLAARYPPFAGKIKQVQSMSALKPTFDRSGKSTGVTGLLWALFLGGQDSKSGLVRWVGLLIFAFGVRQILERRAR